MNDQTRFRLALLVIGAAACYHFRILAEGRSCLARYRDAYRDYVARVPGYLFFSG
jgi:protein-S-isoprenylcysteine O-methyltransferase Ste14